MKLDLNKPWVMRLVRNHSTKNGCSFIRGVLLHYLWKGFLLGLLGIVGTWIVISLIMGPYLYFFGHDFFAGGNISMDYFGEGTIYRFLSISFFIGGMAWIFAAVIGSLCGLAFGFVHGLKATIHSGVVGKALDKLPSFSIPVPLKEAVTAWHDKFCPKIELVLPAIAEGYVVGARILKRSWNCETDQDEFVKGGTIVASDVVGRCLRLGILWDSEKQRVDEGIAELENTTPEGKDQLRKSLYETYTYTQRFWLDEEDSDWDDIKLAPVEEVSSPQ